MFIYINIWIHFILKKKEKEWAANIPRNGHYSLNLLEIFLFISNAQTHIKESICN